MTNPLFEEMNGHSGSSYCSYCEIRGVRSTVVRSLAFVAHYPIAHVC